ncbi:tetratricopeptide repeat protein [Polaromonas sp. JS666]|uniref:tetratricopeptide repeat protein n=1 Tax=Polaromonas sp. (strain JS666 / ATCC BAA-500) TaxID=296591 RepID=UPI00088C5108|nr:tetratricopeptide repeat protein [Polaromonas sp. JS666]SDN49875.1 Predicted methyltransferase, contains TPR repeat [Polaromonas sp. JS666]
MLEELKILLSGEPPAGPQEVAAKRQGDQHLNLGQFDEAVACYQQAVSLNPRFAAAYVGLGFSLVEQQKFAEAAVALERALAIDTSLADAHYLLGKAAKALDDHPESVRHFTQALALKPDFEFAYRDLFDLLLGAGKTEDAKAVVRRAILALPNSAEFRFLLGNLLFNQQDFAGAISCHGKAVALEPTAVVSHKMMGDAYGYLGQHTKAAECYEKAIAIAPANADIHAALGNVMSASGQGEKAMAFYRRAIELAPGHVTAHRLLGNAFLKRGDKEGAIACYRRVVELQPDSPVTHMVAALSGEQRDSTPSGYVAQLFDEYAQTFDSHLVQTLHYDAPEKLMDLVREVSTPAARQWSVLDLGCGTGLSGLAISPYAKELVGVDLSANMLVKAGARRIYTRLERMDLLAMMKEEAASSYDVVISTDVFIYVGRLDGLFGEAQRLLRAGGLFAFSVESLDAVNEEVKEGPDMLDARDFRLNTTGRYTHSRAYLTRIALHNGFEMLRTKEVMVRVEGTKTAPGYLMLWRRCDGGVPQPA